MDPGRPAWRRRASALPWFIPGIDGAMARTTASWSWSMHSPDRKAVLVYTSDAGLRARVHALGAEVAGARTLLDEFAAARDAVEPSASGGP